MSLGGIVNGLFKASCQWGRRRESRQATAIKTRHRVFASLGGAAEHLRDRDRLEAPVRDLESKETIPAIAAARAERSAAGQCGEAERRNPPRGGSGTDYRAGVEIAVAEFSLERNVVSG